MSDETHSWKICSSCKKSIALNETYWICSVSTCNQKRTGWAFCRVECWDAHIPKMNHRECWAVEMHSPSAPYGTPRRISDPATSGELAGDGDERNDTGNAAKDAPSISSGKQPTSTTPRTIIRRRAN